MGVSNLLLIGMIFQVTVLEMLERCHRGPEASAAHPWLERAARQGHAAVRGAKGTTGFSGRCLGR